MKRTVNLKAVMILVGAAAGLGFSVHFVHAFQVKRNAGALIEQAAEAEQQGNPGQAVKFLEQYLGLRPDDRETRARYGLLLKASATTRAGRVKAYLVLDRALRESPDRADLRREVARLALVDLRRFSDAKAHLEVLLKTAPDDGELEGMLGQCEQGNLRFDKAEECYNRATQHAPGSIENFVLHADLLRFRLERPEDGDGVVATMLEGNPGSVSARLAAARYHARAGAWEAAEGDVRFALDHLGAREPELFILASQVAHGRFRRTADQARARAFKDQERQYLEKGLGLHPLDTRLNLALARLELQNGRRDQALECLRRIAEPPPAQADDLVALGDLLIDAGEVEGARRAVERLGERGDTPVAAFLRARLLARNEEWTQARLLLERNEAALRSPEWVKRSDLLLAECHERLDNPDAALAAYNRALQLDRLWLPATLGQAAVLLRLGKTDEAVAAYRKAVHLVPELGLDLARVLLRRNRALPPDQQSWDEVDRALDRLPAEMRPSAEAVVVRAEALAARHRLDEARGLLEAEAARQPKEVLPRLALAGLAQRRGKPDEAAAVLDQVEKDLGKRADVALARVSLALGQERARVRARLGELEQSLDGFPTEDRDRVRRGLAAAYDQAGEQAAALRLWQQLAKSRPNDLGVRLRLLQEALRTGCADDVQRVADEISRIEGDGGPWGLYAGAARLVLKADGGDRSGLAEAQRELAAAVSQRPSWAAPLVLEGRILELQNDPDQALEKYQHAIELGERQPAVLRRAVDLLSQRRRYAEAQEVLHKLPEQALASSDLGRRAAELSLLTGEHGGAPDRRRALELARQAVPADSANYRDYLWLGQVALAAGQRGEAEKMLRKALALGEKEADAWVAWVLFLARADAKEAEAAIDKAGGKLAPDAAPLALAACYEAVGKTDRAAALYESILAARPDDPVVLRSAAGFYTRHGRAGPADGCLRKLIASDKTSAAGRRWGRRQLAMSLGQAGDYRKFREALSLLDQNTEGAPEAFEDARARALVLATQPARRREGIAILERYSKNRSLTEAEQFLLARMYDAEGDANKARALLLNLVNAQGTNPLYVAPYCRLLLARGEADAAAGWVARLEAGEKTPSLGTVTLRARVLRKQDRTDEAARVLNEYAQHHPDQAANVAAVLEEVGRPAEAEKLYRAFVATAKRPEAVLVLAQHLGRQRRTAEALDLCDRAWATCPPEAVAGTSLGVLHAGKPAPEQLQAVDGRLAAAVEKDPKSHRLLWLRAELKELQNRFPEAVTLYRKVLELAPDHAVALNNLAWLRAFEEGGGPEAVELVNKAVEMVGPGADFLDTRAVALLAVKQPEPAVADLEEVVRQKPAAVCYFHLARAHHQARNRKAAAEALHKAEGLGLTPGGLHPLERAWYRELFRDLAR